MDLVAVLVLCCVSLLCSLVTLARTLAPLVAHPLARTNTLAQRPKRRLRSAQSFTVWLTCFDACAVGVLVWEYVVSDARLGTSALSISRCFFALFARPTLLLLISLLSYVSVASNKPVTLGTGDLALLLPSVVLLGVGTGCVALAGSGSLAVWIGFVAWLGFITAIAIYCFARLLLAVVRMRRNDPSASMAAHNQANDSFGLPKRASMAFDALGLGFVVVDGPNTPPAAAASPEKSPFDVEANQQQQAHVGVTSSEETGLSKAESGRAVARMGSYILGSLCTLGLALPFLVARLQHPLDAAPRAQTLLFALAVIIGAPLLAIQVVLSEGGLLASQPTPYLPTSNAVNRPDAESTTMRARSSLASPHPSVRQPRKVASMASFKSGKSGMSFQSIGSAFEDQTGMLTDTGDVSARPASRMSSLLNLAAPHPVLQVLAGPSSVTGEYEMSRMQRPRSNETMQSFVIGSDISTSPDISRRNSRAHLLQGSSGRVHHRSLSIDYLTAQILPNLVPSVTIGQDTVVDDSLSPIASRRSSVASDRKGKAERPKQRRIRHRRQASMPNLRSSPGSSAERDASSPIIEVTEANTSNESLRRRLFRSKSTGQILNDIPNVTQPLRVTTSDVASEAEIQPGQYRSVSPYERPSTSTSSIWTTIIEEENTEDLIEASALSRSHMSPTTPELVPLPDSSASDGAENDFSWYGDDLESSSQSITAHPLPSAARPAEQRRSVASLIYHSYAEALRPSSSASRKSSGEARRPSLRNSLSLGSDKSSPAQVTPPVESPISQPMPATEAEPDRPTALRPLVMWANVPLLQQEKGKGKEREKEKEGPRSPTTPIDSVFLRGTAAAAKENDVPASPVRDKRVSLGRKRTRSSKAKPLKASASMQSLKQSTPTRRMR